ncbi:MAG TPA: DUF6702 family protein [Sphingobacteriaceae bacterium]|nr:DUF6702 family protein [Sphingobacteriaceae bacterium]
MLQFVIAVLISIFHPFFVSVTEIKHNEKTKSIEISSKIFFDDFESALEKKYHTPIDILKPADRKKVNQLINDYLSKHLILKINGKPVKMIYLGYEIEEDGAWCYFEVPEVKKVSRIDIVNNILFENHPSQINMLHVTVKGIRKSTKLDNPESKASFAF